MNDEKENSSSTLNEEDAQLWQSTTGDVKRLPGKKYLEGSAKAPDKALDDEVGGGEIVMPEREASKARQAKGHDLDRRTEERLRKGQMSIEGRLDLHGMSQDQAFDALKAFIESSYAQGKRCLLVITGKGQSKSQTKDWFEPQIGILKQRVPEWLSQADLKPLVLKAVPAHRKDGGNGALYVLLRRKR